MPKMVNFGEFKCDILGDFQTLCIYRITNLGVPDLFLFNEVFGLDGLDRIRLKHSPVVVLKGIQILILV